MNIDSGKSFVPAVGAFMLRFSFLFVNSIAGDRIPNRETYEWLANSIEWITALLLIASLVIAFIDDVANESFAHTTGVVLMSLVLNFSLVLMVNISIGVMFGALAVVFVIACVDSSLGGPMTALLGAVLSALGILTPIILIILALGFIFGLNSLF